jgi:hypothetical protein
MRENSDYSPMKNHIIDQCARILELVRSKELFCAHTEDFSNIVAAMNEQICNYNRAARRAVLRDVYEDIIEHHVNWEQLKEHLADAMRSPELYNGRELPRIPTTKNKLKEYDDEEILMMLQAKNPCNHRQSVIRSLEMLVLAIDVYESNMCAYRRQVHQVVREMIDILYQRHANYVKAMVHPAVLRAGDLDTLTYDGKTMKIAKSQQQFLREALTFILDITAEDAGHRSI